MELLYLARYSSAFIYLKLAAIIILIQSLELPSPPQHTEPQHSCPSVYPGPLQSYSLDEVSTPPVPHDVLVLLFYIINVLYFDVCMLIDK